MKWERWEKWSRAARVNNWIICDSWSASHRICSARSCRVVRSIAAGKDKTGASLQSYSLTLTCQSCLAFSSSLSLNLLDWINPLYLGFRRKLTQQKCPTCSDHVDSTKCKHTISQEPWRLFDYAEVIGFNFTVKNCSYVNNETNMFVSDLVSTKLPTVLFRVILIKLHWGVWLFTIEFQLDSTPDFD